MELEDKIRCNELLKEKHSNWLGVSNQKAIRSMLEELDRLQKENEELKSFKEKIKQIIEENVPIKEFLGVKNAVFDVNTCTYVTREIYDLLKEE